MKKDNQTKYLVESGLIAALYFCLNFVSSAAGLSYGPIQLRLSEALCLLPVIMPSAVPGLAVGCALANIMSPYGVVDVAVGSLATLVAAVLVRRFRNVTWKNIPFLSALMPVLINGIFVGAEIAFLQPSSGARAVTFLVTMGEVALGEILAMVLAVLLLKAIGKRFKTLDRRK